MELLLSRDSLLRIEGKEAQLRPCPEDILVNLIKDFGVHPVAAPLAGRAATQRLSNKDSGSKQQTLLNTPETFSRSLVRGSLKSPGHQAPAF